MKTPDYGLCPVCQEPTDNGHSRELPPEAYLCSACACRGTFTAEVGLYTEGLLANGADTTVVTIGNPDANVPTMIPSNWPAPDYDILEYVKRCWAPDHTDLNRNDQTHRTWGVRLLHADDEVRKLRITIRRLEVAHEEREKALMAAWLAHEEQTE